MRIMRTVINAGQIRKRESLMENEFWIIVDLDGFLYDDEWRRHHLPTYEAYHVRAIQDNPRPAELVTIHALQVFANCKTMIVTGRPDEFREATEIWLKDWKVTWDELHMRPEGDDTPSDEYKRRIVEPLMKERGILCAFEDRDKCVRMFRDLGITTFQNKDGAY